MNDRLFELASELEQEYRDTAIAKVRAQLVGKARVECVDCGATIPESRRTCVPGCNRCLHCQQQHESRQRRYHR